MRMGEGVEWGIHCCLTIAWLEDQGPIPTTSTSAGGGVAAGARGGGGPPPPPPPPPRRCVPGICGWIR
ncbi:hypothetical protein [Nocardia cyriacigeorgica]|uniref:hypothetical protein n=1 Tax=Nocardia cyriacigeorgica TaxID=135487 RepID=UPI00245811EA|nr:hypothetical protein [Nocardia cyriacigeorgica]